MDFKSKNTVAPIQKNIFNQVPSHITPGSSEINDLAEKVDAKVMIEPFDKTINGNGF